MRKVMFFSSRFAEWVSRFARAARRSAPTGLTTIVNLNLQPQPHLLTFVLAFLPLVLPVLPASAAFIPAASSGPTSDAQGEQTRGKIATAISDADEILATLGSDNIDNWVEPWRAFYGTAAATEAKAVVTEIRSALAGLRDGWDRFSVQTISLKKGWNCFYAYTDDPAPAAAVFCPSNYAARLRSRVAAELANPMAESAVLCLDSIAKLAQSFIDIRTSLIKTFSSSAAIDWPVENVYVYMGSTDASSQFSTDSTAEATASNPYLTWSVNAPDSVNLSSIPAGRVCTTFSTNDSARTVVLFGTAVRAGSMTWHKTGGSENPAEWNFLGVPIISGRPSADKLMTNLDFTYTSLAKLTGTDQAQPGFSVASTASALTVADGETLIADANATSSWYPAPICSPSDGITIAAGAVETSFQLRNDTAAAQVITGRLYRTGNLASALNAITGVFIMRSQASGWQPWSFDQQSKEYKTTATNQVFVDTLAAGETRTYRVRFQRTAWDVLAREAAYSGDFRRTFSGVMRFNFGGNPTCTYLSLAAASDNNSVATPWPMGLWVGTFAFDKVSQVKGNQTIVHNVPAKGTMRVRGLVHVSNQGSGLECRLLHHVIVESITSSNSVDGTYVATTLYAGRAKPDTGTGATITRLDSIAMDIDNPIVGGTGTFTNGVTTFAWTVMPEGRANPFHHPYHPDHDGLQWDFETPAPSGDDMNNYRQGQVKPETWSIENELALEPDAFDVLELPDTITGTCTWTLGNVRRSVNGENIRASGTYSLKRIKSVGKLIEQ